MNHRTKVEKYGAFWKVLVFRSGEWLRTRDNYLTRADARAGRVYWAAA